MKKIKYILLYSLMLFSVALFTVGLSSCDNNNTDNNEETGLTKDDLRALKFEDLTVDYNGSEHSIYVQDVPEGVKVTYTNNGQKFPGEYTIVAKIQYNDISVSKIAKLKINSVQSVLEAEAKQTSYSYGGKVNIDYKINNDEQYVAMNITQNGKKLTESDLRKEGVYTIDLYAPSLAGYSESNHVTIELTVIYSIFDISFDDVNEVYDGNPKNVELTGNIPDGYTVTYENNTATEPGTYYALAKISDANGEVVETHAATLTIDNPENEEFAEYLDDFFVLYLEGDQLSVNIFCENPEDFGLSHYDATWYTYESYTDEDITDALNDFNELLDELKKFEDAKLNDLQEVAYRNIEKFLNYYIEYYSIENCNLMKILYIDSFGGYVADFGTYMEAYSLRSEQDVIDVINYIDSTDTAFASYLDFVEDKTNAGYALSDYTITEMRTYLEDVIAEGDNYYLKDILNAKIDELEFLDETQKADYKAQIAAKISDSFVPGVQTLYDGLESYLGKLTKEDEGYWATYDNGKTMFELELNDLLGFDELDVKAYISELDQAFSSAVSYVYSAQSTLVNKHNITTYAELEALVAKHVIFNGTPDEMMVYLKEFAKTIVPNLISEPDINIKNMDLASAKVSNAVAYYMKSALDNTAGENITLNPTKLGDSNDVLGTLSHEGYPGHLYAYVYSKEIGLSNLSTIMTNTAHGEGWATYVELKLYEYAQANSDDQTFKDVMDYLYANQLSGFLLETRIDAGIHLEGWTVEDVSNYLEKKGYNAEAAQDIYNLLIEMPTGYAAYGYGKLFFNNLHKKAKTILGGFYDEIEFNAMLLSKGWTNLGELQNTYNEYMKAKCHKHGIAFE